MKSFVHLRRENEKEQSNKTFDTTENLGDDLRCVLNNFSLTMSRLPKENAILKNLYHSSMHDRQSSIKIAETGTFRWIIEDDESSFSYDEHGGFDESSTSYSGMPDKLKDIRFKAQVRSAFGDWLKAGDGFFHVSGKAGSGKSTLMNFLLIHPRTESLLLTWAGEKTLIFASFFFWKSGSKMQASLQGLYRSILFEILENCTELISRLFPQDLSRLSKNDAQIDGDFISDFAIERAFDSLISQESFSGYRLRLFIDGPDEYEGDSKDHVILAERLLQWTTNTDVKICASSRPYNEFIHVFSDSTNQRMHLHELNERNIYLFIRETIEEDRNFECIKDHYLPLVNKLVWMSDGIFLWPALVVRSLPAGMLRRDTIEALEEKLCCTPKDINHLYDQLFESMDLLDRIRAIKMLLLAAHNPMPTLLDATFFAWVDDLHDPNFPPTGGVRPSSWSNPSEIFAKVQRQLAGITKGLLHISPSEIDSINCVEGFHVFNRPRVHFLHCSVRDYALNLTDDDVVSAQCKEVIVPEAYVRLWIAEMTLFEPGHRLIQWNNFWCFFIKELIPEELSIHLVDAVHLLTTTSDPYSDSVARESLDPPSFCGLWKGPQNGEISNQALSFLHLAAYTSQQQLVMRELRNCTALPEDKLR